MRYRVRNLTRNTLLGDEIDQADTFFSRFRGLLGVATLPVGRGLLIEPCNQIHMFFMQIPLDVLFLDRERVVVEVLHAFAPWRVSRRYSQARAALELPAGIAAASQTEAGDRLEILRAA